MSNFDDAFEYAMTNEGGLESNPNDSGGLTKYGLTRNVISSFFGKPTVSDDDIKNITKEQAKEVYSKVFWFLYRMDEIQSKEISIALFDVMINQGPSRVVKRVQTIVGVKPDGIMGPDTIKKLNNENPNDFLNEFIHLTLMSYVDLVIMKPVTVCFLRGWVNRAERLRTLLIKNP